MSETAQLGVEFAYEGATLDERISEPWGTDQLPRFKNEVTLRDRQFDEAIKCLLKVFLQSTATFRFVVVAAKLFPFKLLSGSAARVKMANGLPNNILTYPHSSYSP